jgi:hypothetical protein
MDVRCGALDVGGAAGSATAATRSAAALVGTAAAASATAVEAAATTAATTGEISAPGRTRRRVTSGSTATAGTKLPGPARIEGIVAALSPRSTLVLGAAGTAAAARGVVTPRTTTPPYSRVAGARAAFSATAVVLAARRIIEALAARAAGHDHAILKRIAALSNV